jgi:hypothetical protein
VFLGLGGGLGIGVTLGDAGFWAAGVVFLLGCCAEAFAIVFGPGFGFVTAALAAGEGVGLGLGIAVSFVILTDLAVWDCG